MRLRATRSPIQQWRDVALLLVNTVTASRSSFTLTPLCDQPVGNYSALNQDRSAIDHNRLASAESFLH